MAQMRTPYESSQNMSQQNNMMPQSAMQTQRYDIAPPMVTGSTLIDGGMGADQVEYKVFY
jgi:hypothetical protein